MPETTTYLSPNGDNLTHGGPSWACIADDVHPVSKDDHHLPFLSEDQRREAMAVRNLL